MSNIRNSKFEIFCVTVFKVQSSTLKVNLKDSPKHSSLCFLKGSIQVTTYQNAHILAVLSDTLYHFGKTNYVTFREYRTTHSTNTTVTNLFFEKKSPPCSLSDRLHTTDYILSTSTYLTGSGHVLT